MVSLKQNHFRTASKLSYDPALPGDVVESHSGGESSPSSPVSPCSRVALPPSPRPIGASPFDAVSETLPPKSPNFPAVTNSGNRMAPPAEESRRRSSRREIRNCTRTSTGSTLVSAGDQFQQKRISSRRSSRTPSVAPSEGYLIYPTRPRASALPGGPDQNHILSAQAASQVLTVQRDDFDWRRCELIQCVPSLRWLVFIPCWLGETEKWWVIYVMDAVMIGANVFTCQKQGQDLFRGETSRISWGDVVLAFGRFCSSGVRC